MTTLQQTTTAAVLIPDGLAQRFVRWILGLVTGSWRLAKKHDLNPWVFIGMSAVGWIIHGLVYMPWLQGQAWQLAFLILLRLVGLVVPIYIVAKGKRLALAFNVSVAVIFAVNTAWHVCYYVFL